MTTDARGERAALLGRDVSSTPRANADAAVLDVERGDDGAGRRDGRARGGRRVAAVVAAALAATAVTIGAVRGTAGAGGAAALGSKPTASAKALRNARIAAAAKAAEEAEAERQRLLNEAHPGREQRMEHRAARRAAVEKAAKRNEVVDVERSALAEEEGGDADNATLVVDGTFVDADNATLVVGDAIADNSTIAAGEETSEVAALGAQHHARPAHHVNSAKARNERIAAAAKRAQEALAAKEAELNKEHPKREQRVAHRKQQRAKAAISAVTDVGGTAATGSTESALPTNTPKIYIISDTQPGEELENAKSAQAYVANLFETYAGMDSSEAAKVASIEEETFPARWPDTLETAKVATMGMTEGDDVRFPVKDVQATLADKDQHCVGEACKLGLQKHLGSMLSHMAVWKKALDSGADSFVVWESTALAKHAVSPLDYAELESELPENTDMVFLEPDYLSPGQFVKKIKSSATGTWGEHTHGAEECVNQSSSVYLYKHNHMCGGVGTSALMFTKRGAQRLRDYVATNGAGMISTWLNSKCIAKHADGLNFNCYIAQTKKLDKSMLGGVVPTWYDDERVVSESVPQPDIDEMDFNPKKFNQLGCARGGRAFAETAAWLPISADHTVDSERVVSNCMMASIATSMGYTIDPCAADLPLRQSDLNAQWDALQRRARAAKADGASVASLSLALSDDAKAYLFESDNDVPYGNLEDVASSF